MRTRLSLRGRMVMTAVAAAGVALAVLLLLAGPTLDRRARDQAFAGLTAEARLMARVVEEQLGRGTSPEALDPVVDAASREVDARVTVIAPDGKVLADSAASGTDLETVANHADRPEVQGALAGQTSRARAPQRHRGHRAPLRGRAGALRRAGGGRRAPLPRHRGDRGAEPGSLAGRGPRPGPGPPRDRSPLGPPLVLAGTLARGDHGDRPAVREGQPGRPHPGRPRRRARRAGAHHQPVRRPAAGADGGDRPRPGAHRRHPLRHGRRRSRGGPPGHRHPRQPEPRTKPWISATPSAVTTSR